MQRAWFRAFPDFTWSGEAPLVDGHRVAQMATVSGTDTGGFMGLPPTGKAFRFVHERRIYDFTGFLVQIGMLRAKPA